MKKILILLLISLSFAFVSSPTYASGGSITGPDVIYKQSDKVLTMSTVKTLYASDEGSIEVLQDNYTGFGNIPGIYTVKLGVQSTAITKDIQISVRTTIGDVIAVTQSNDTYTIHMFKNKTLTLNQIIKILENVQYIVVTSTTEIQILTDTYSDNKDAPGLYVFEFYLANTSGFEAEYTVNIKVNNTEQLLPDIIVQDSRSLFWERFGEILSITVGAILILVALLVIMKVNKKFKGKRGIL